MDKDAIKSVKCENRCRVCRVPTEDIPHIIRSSLKMSTRYYQLMWNDVVVRTLCNEIYRNDYPEDNEERTYSMLEAIASYNQKEYW